MFWWIIGNNISALQNNFPRTVTLPVYQVLETLSPATTLQEGLDGVDRTTIDNPGGRRGSEGGHKQTFLDMV